MKTILIVGGSGFMGAYFTEYFVAKGYKVIHQPVSSMKMW